MVQHHNSCFMLTFVIIGTKTLVLPHKQKEHEKVFFIYPGSNIGCYSLVRSMCNASLELASACPFRLTDNYILAIIGFTPAL